MAAKGEQIPAPAAVASPMDAPEPAPDRSAGSSPRVDGESRHGSAAAGAAGEGHGGELRGESQVPRRGGGAAEGDENAGEEGRDEGAGGGEVGGGSGCRGGGERERGEGKGGLLLPDAKRRRKACAAGLEKLATPPPAADLAGDDATSDPGAGGPGGARDAAAGGRGVGGGGGEASPSPFSFSFDTRGFFPVPAIETTPKFGSFNFSAISGAGEEPLGTAPAPAPGGRDEERGQDAVGELQDSRRVDL